MFQSATAVRTNAARTMRIAPLAVLLASLAVGVQAQDSTPVQAQPSSIRVSGDATVTVVPDRVQIDVGVVTQAPQSQDAAAQNAQRLETVLRALRKAGGKEAQIRTISYSLQPNYRYPRDGGEPEISGYTASNVVRVTLDDLSRIGSLIDSATQSGANQIQSIQFTLKDEQAARSQALREAVAKARAKADALAAALGVKVARILAVVESSEDERPMRQVMFARAEAVDAVRTPIQPGTIEVRADITLTVEISQ